MNKKRKKIPKGGIELLLHVTSEPWRHSDLWLLRYHLDRLCSEVLKRSQGSRMRGSWPS